VDWPPWWEWELELTPHLERRMEDRDFNELDLRTMLQSATGWRDDIVERRFVIETEHARTAWEVIVEPDGEAHTLVVVTAYAVRR
jgi:hypothetical protein